MKTIQITGGITLIVVALLLSFGIIVSSLKEGDEENMFKYLTIPVVMLVLGIYLILKGRNLKSKAD
jgi:hypothetical protein